jgi:NADH-quinone oxidoreductase subunit M
MNLVQIAPLDGIPALTLAWALPALFAGALAALRAPRLRLTLGWTAAVVQLALAVRILVGFSSGESLVEDLGPQLLLRYHLGVDGLNVLFLPLLALLNLLVVAYGSALGKARQPGWLSATLGLQAALTGMLLAHDLVLFGIFSATELIPVAVLIRRFGTGRDREEVASLFLRFFGAALVLWFAGVAALGVAHLRAEGHWSTDLPDLLSDQLPVSLQLVAFVLLLTSLAIRLPMFPLHGWLPRVVASGPLVGLNVVLLGVKVGAYGILRFVIPLFPEASARLDAPITVLGVLGLVYGALLALAQRDLRRMLAFACVAHIGLITPGLFSLNGHGMEGGLLQMINLGLSSAGLYFVVGFLHQRAGSSDLDRLRGFAASVPLLGFSFLVVILSSIGMPGTAGFDALHHVLEGAIESRRYGLALSVGLGTVALAGSLLWVHQRIFVRAPGHSPVPVADLRLRELVITGTLASILFGLGVYGEPALHAIEGSVHAISARFEPPATAATPAAPSHP